LEDIYIYLIKLILEESIDVMYFSLCFQTRKKLKHCLEKPSPRIKFRKAEIDNFSEGFAKYSEIKLIMMPLDPEEFYVLVS